MICFMKWKWFYFLLSALVLLPGIFSLAVWGIKPSIDFTGGTLLELRFEQDIKTMPAGRQELGYENIKKIGSERGFEISSAQSSGEKTILLRTKPINKEEAASLKSAIAQEFSEMPEELRFETVGPILGRELLVKTLIAVLLAALVIMAYVAWAFKEARFGICAILAMFHDSLVLLGSFSLLGHFFGAEMDTLFVTAMLTILSFSVHDTVVVYDRIRESIKKYPGIPFEELANRAVTETMSRSLNNSLTIIFMLLALFLLGGETTRWFALAILIGTISGTYSSPFTAVPLLVVWEQIKGQKK